MLLRCEAEPTRSGEIQRARIASDFTQHERQVAATQPLFQCEQRVLRSPGFDVDQPVAQFGWKPVTIGAPGQSHRCTILHPQQLAPVLLRRAGSPGHFQRIARQGERQPRPARLIAACKNLAVRGRGQARPPVRQAGTQQRRSTLASDSERRRFRGMDGRMEHIGTTHLFLLCSIQSRFAIAHKRKGAARRRPLRKSSQTQITHAADGSEPSVPRLRHRQPPQRSRAQGGCGCGNRRNRPATRAHPRPGGTTSQRSAG